MNSAIFNFLKDHYVEGVFATHVSMTNPKGSYQFYRDSYDTFWDIYCKELIQKGDKLVCGLAEKPQTYLPVLADIDIKKTEEEMGSLSLEINEKGEEHMYSEKNLRDVVQIFQSVLRNTIEDCTDDHLLCVVLEKPMYFIIKNGLKIYKSGIHYHFPNCFLSKVEQETHIIPRVKQALKELNVFENLDIEDSSSLLDENYTKTPWLIYGGRKDGENMIPYTVSKIINSEGNEISIEEAFKYYSIYDVKEQLVDIKGKIEENLPRILSILPNGRMCSELKYGLPLLKKDKFINNQKSITSSLDNYIKETKTEQLRIAKKLVAMLSDFRTDDRNEWLTIGWILYNISDGSDEGLDIWIEFSSRNEEKFDENECINQWEKMTKKDLTIRTLHYFAKIDNEEMYKEFKREQGEKHIKESLEGSHNDIAKLLFTEYGTDFVCSSIVNRTWYQFKNHHWEEIEEGTCLRQLISSEIVVLYSKQGGEMFAQKALADKTDESFYQLRIKQLSKLISSLKSSPFKSNIMKEACEVFYNKNFSEKLNTNPYLIGFKNGVYDLKLNLFRAGRPEDYISKYMRINYINFTNTDQRILNVHDYLEKVFPDTSVRQYFLDTTSDVFEGGNKQKIIIFWTGDGDNAKSVTQTIIEKILGEYAIKFSTTLVTGKKASIGSASPELSRAGGGVRWAVLEEPDGDEELNIGILKALSGNDSYWARDLFEKGKSTREITPLFKLIFICVSGDTKVSLSSGVSFSIQNLKNNKNTLLSWDEKTNGLLNTKQHAFLDKGIQDCLTITLLDGRNITCTPNHKLLTNDNKWIEAKDITTGIELKMGVDNVVCDDIFENYNFILNCGEYQFNLAKFEDKICAMAFCRLLGYMLTDGTLNKTLYICHKIDCETILQDIELLTNKRPTITLCNNVFKIEIPYKIRRAFNICSEIQNGGRVNNPMTLPDFVFDENCPTFLIREFIASMFGGDGNIPSLYKNTFNSIQLVSSKIEKHVSSLELIFTKLSEVLYNRFGIESKLYKQEYTKDNIKVEINKESQIENGPYKDSKRYHVFLNINKKNSIIKFCDKIGIRYCCHKSYRLIAIKSVFAYKNAIIKQNIKIIKRAEELYNKYNRQNNLYLIGQYDINDNLIKIYTSTQKVQNETGIHHSNIRNACKKNGKSEGYKWKFINQINEKLDEPGCSSIKNAREQAIAEYKNDNIIYENYLVTYSQLRRYITDKITYKMPNIDIRKYLIETNLIKFCNQNKGKKYHNYSVPREKTTLPCYNMKVINIRNVGKTHVYDINIDEPYSNFVANGIVTHNCNTLPNLRKSDPAFWNRAKVIPFESTFVRASDPNPAAEKYEEQLLQKRFPMDTEFYKKIPDMLEPFAWLLLEHRKAIQGKGRIEPEKVRIATEMYRKQNDIYRQFVDECVVESNSHITILQLYTAFRDWFKLGFPGHQLPVKNEIQEYFTKLWNEPEKGIKWFGYRIRTLDEEIEDGTAVILSDEDLINYDDTKSISGNSVSSNNSSSTLKKLLSSK